MQTTFTPDAYDIRMQVIRAYDFIPGSYVARHADEETSRKLRMYRETGNPVWLPSEYADARSSLLVQSSLLPSVKESV